MLSRAEGSARRKCLSALVAVGLGLLLATSSAVAAPVIKNLGDLNAGPGDGDPSNFTKLGKKVLFVATDENKGREVWRTDGTAAGTKIVKDINPGGDSWPNGFSVLNGKALFSADNGGGEELWRTDGTAAGTKKVKDINGDPNTGSVEGITSVYGNYLYFYADDGVHGVELWRSDGTASGTKMLKDVNPGSGDSDRCCLAQIGNTVLFQAYQTGTGYELWKTDGTPAGTSLVEDVNSGPTDSFPLDNGTVAGNRYFFCEWPDDELWVTDGTPAGTHMLKDFDYCAEPVPYGSDVLVVAALGSGVELWRSDGTVNGTVQVADVNPSGDSYPFAINRKPINGKYFIHADNGTDGQELYVYNGSTLTMVEDINPSGSSTPGNFGNRSLALGNKLFFEADDGTHGREPWITDGTAAGTFMLKDIASNAAGSEPYAGQVVNGLLYFAADNAAYGREIWRTNGTSLGTKRVTDINPGSGDSTYYGGDSAIGGKIYFGATDGTHGIEPYRLTP